MALWNERRFFFFLFGYMFLKALAGMCRCICEEQAFLHFFFSPHLSRNWSTSRPLTQTRSTSLESIPICSNGGMSQKQKRKEKLGGRANIEFRPSKPTQTRQPPGSALCNTLNVSRHTPSTRNPNPSVSFYLALPFSSLFWSYLCDEGCHYRFERRKER